MLELCCLMLKSIISIEIGLCLMVSGLSSNVSGSPIKIDNKDPRSALFSVLPLDYVSTILAVYVLTIEIAIPHCLFLSKTFLSLSILYF